MTNLNDIHTLFKNQEDWDFEIPNEGHEKRFLQKIKKKQQPKKRKYWIPLSIAASLLIGFGLLYVINTNNQKNEQVVFSPQVQETHDYFSSVITSELALLKKKENKQNKALIADAQLQLEAIESDYEHLKTEIAKNGENKQIVYAMITNMQTRISFIKSVLDQIESINQLNTYPDEKHS